MKKILKAILITLYSIMFMSVPMFAEGGEEQETTVNIETPASVTGEKQDGSATVIDYTLTGKKAFYTIKDQDDNIFYLIIDLEKAENNVYFLSEINGDQLKLSGQQANQTQQVINGSTGVTNGTNAEQVNPGENLDSSNASSGINPSYIYIGVGLVIFFIAAVYFKIIKPKQAAKKAPIGAEEDEDFDDFDDFDDEDEEEEE